MSSESRNEQTETKGEAGYIHRRNETGGEGAEVEGHVIRMRSEETGDDEADWVGGRGEEGIRRD